MDDRRRNQLNRAPSVHSHIDNDQSQTVQVFLSVRNIPKLDLFSPSDPFIVISMKNARTGTWSEHSITEIVWDTPNADFVKRITMNYIFEEVQQLRFEVYDADTKDANRRAAGRAREGATDFIGQVTTTMAELVTRTDSRLQMNLKTRGGQTVRGKNKQPSKIIIRSEEVSSCQDVVLLQFSGRKLPKMDTFGRADPFLQMYRSTEDGRWVAVAKTEYIKRTYNPNWKPMLIKVQQLCNGDYHRPIMIRCFDWNANSAPDFMGEVETSLDAVLRGEVKEMMFRRRGKKRTYGSLIVKKKRLRQQNSFIEYIRGGMEIQLMVAVDFTASNGDPRDRKSLHYMGRNGRLAQDNDYLRAIKSVGRVLEPYDSDNMIPGWGFGAKMRGEGTANHCFSLNMNEDNAEVLGIAGIVEAYRQALPNLTLSGPTLLSQVIGTSMAMTTEPYSADHQHYTILLIITDGVINDKQQATDTIVHCTNYPMSIIICGVGNADFSTMEYLDADDEPLISSDGVMMKRDIVQFVPFNEFKNTHPTLFAKEVLEEIPDQVTSYMAQHGVKPIGWRPRQEDIKRYQMYMSESFTGPIPGAIVAGEQKEGHADVPGASQSIMDLEPRRPVRRRSSSSLLMDQLGAGALQNRPYYTKTQSGRVAGVNTGHEDDYLYQDNGGCCIVM